MADSLAVTFSSATDREFTLVSRMSFWKAPSRPRSSETVLIAELMIFWAAIVFPPVREALPPDPRLDRYPTTLFPREVAATDPTPTLVCPERSTWDPSWNLAPPPVT